MAQTQTEWTGTTGDGNYGAGTGAFGAAGVDALIPFAKEAWGIQLKTAQMVLDNSAKLSQTFAEFYQTQAAEGLKLTQTCFATGKTVAEEMRRQFTTFADKAGRQN